MGPARPKAVNECATQIIPSLILLFDGLRRAYAAKCAESDDDENDEDDSDVDVGECLVCITLVIIRNKIQSIGFVGFVRRVIIR